MNKNIAIIGKQALAIAAEATLKERVICRMPKWSDQLLNHHDIKTVIDLRPGAGSYNNVMTLLTNAKHVITNNALLIRLHGTPLRAAAETYRRHLCFSSAVADCGGSALFQLPQQPMSLHLKGCLSINTALENFAAGESTLNEHLESLNGTDELNTLRKEHNHQLELLQQQYFPQATSLPLKNISHLTSDHAAAVQELGYTLVYTSNLNTQQTQQQIVALPTGHPLAQQGYQGFMATFSSLPQQVHLQERSDILALQLQALLADLNSIQTTRVQNITAQNKLAPPQSANNQQRALLLWPQAQELPNTLRLHSTFIDTAHGLACYTFNGQLPAALPTEAAYFPLPNLLPQQQTYKPREHRQWA